jgi:vacuolar-type H+-ATPase subunit C/Vma6
MTVAIHRAATSRGSLAYAYARIRAAKSQLLARADAAPLFIAPDAVAMQRVLTALGLEHPQQRLVNIYQTALRGYSGAEPLLRALLGRHEIENLKLLWRLTAKRDHAGAISRLWLDLEPLATIPRMEATTPREIAERLGNTPYAEIAATAARVHGTDVGAAELALDRWTSQRLLDEVRRLPRRESMAQRLVELVVRERDAELVRRGAKWYGLTSMSGMAAGVAAVRAERLRLCGRSFIGSPFRLAPAIAVILLAEEEARAVQALVEREGDSNLDAPLFRALAGSQLGPAFAAHFEIPPVSRFDEEMAS